MRIVITGSRHWIDRERIRKVIELALNQAMERDETLFVRHGDNPKGADHLASNIVQQYVSSGLYKIVEEPYPADWTRYGKSAGMRRNNEMIETNDVREVHAFPLQDSIGTIGMMKAAAARKIPVYNYGWPGFNDQFEEGQVINVSRETLRPGNR